MAASIQGKAKPISLAGSQHRTRAIYVMFAGYGMISAFSLSLVTAAPGQIILEILDVGRRFRVWVPDRSAPWIARGGTAYASRWSE